ncbi:MAG: MBL fold metallo-hydrolase [Bacteroidales bacterium]
MNMLYPTERLLLNGEIPVNCYIIQRDNECFIVDPGYEKERIIEYVNDRGYVVKGILLTHAHIDHIEALDCFDVPIYLHDREIEILMDSSLNGFDFFNKRPKYCLSERSIIALNDGDRLAVGDGHHIEVVFTPGHTQGSVCYLIGCDLYTGDTLFEGSVGRWDRPTGDLNELKASIARLMRVIPDNYLIHPSHYRSSTILLEKQHNSFVREWYFNM